jgi:hypothetical protein
LDARAALLERRMAAHHVELASTHKLPSKLRAAAAGASSAAASAASLAELERHADELRTRLRRAGTRAEIQATLVERVREVDVYDDALNSAQPSAKQRYAQRATRMRVHAHAWRANALQGAAGGGCGA